MRVTATTTMMLSAAHIAACATAASAQLASDEVVIQWGTTASTSKLEFGLTYVNHQLGTTATSGPNSLDPGAEVAAQQLLAPVIKYQNTHLIGWGPGDVNPSQGVYNWSSYTSRLAQMNELSVSKTNVLTLCSAPGWMTQAGQGNTFAPGAIESSRPLWGYYDDYADLAVEALKKSPNVTHVQVWNEFKGYWYGPNGDQINVAAYTNLYNEVYDAVKAYAVTSGREINVGGLYLNMSGTGSNIPNMGETFMPLSTSSTKGAMERAVVEYWLENKNGADFISFDRATVDWQDAKRPEYTGTTQTNGNAYTRNEVMALTPVWGTAISELKSVMAQTGDSNLPIWISEYYGRHLPNAADSNPASHKQFEAAQYASIYKHMVEGGVSTALTWNGGPGESLVGHALHTDATKSGGGKATPHFYVYKNIATFFGNGTNITQNETGDAMIEVLSSQTHALLINKYDSAKQVKVNNWPVDLNTHEVKLIYLRGRDYFQQESNGNNLGTGQLDNWTLVSGPASAASIVSVGSDKRLKYNAGAAESIIRYNTRTSTNHLSHFFISADIQDIASDPGGWELILQGFSAETGGAAQAAYRLVYDSSQGLSIKHGGGNITSALTMGQIATLLQVGSFAYTTEHDFGLELVNDGNSNTLSVFIDGKFLISGSHTDALPGFFEPRFRVFNGNDLYFDDLHYMAHAPEPGGALLVVGLGLCGLRRRRQLSARHSHD